jgi:hypothetical protein
MLSLTNGSEPGGGLLPRQFFASSGAAIAEIQNALGKEGRTMKRVIQIRSANRLLMVVLLLACFRIGSAVVPPPDGGYPGFTTAQGTNTLKNLTSGEGNTGLKFSSATLRHK